MKKIAIITTFRNAEKGYSLVKIVEDQIKMILDYGKMPVKVVVAEGFEPVREFAREGVEIVTIPDVHVTNEVVSYINDKNFDEDVEKLYKSFKEILKDVSVAITHDIPYQPAGVKHNLALRKVSKDQKDLHFRHWVHSATEPAKLSELRGGGERYLDLIKQPFPNSVFVTFNHYQIQRVANWFDIDVGRVKVVHHPHDFLAYVDPIVKSLAEKYNILSKDRVAVYAARLDGGKQPEFLVEVTASLKRAGNSVSTIFVDFQSASNDSNDPKFKVRQNCKNLALDLDLGEDEIIWMSEFDMPEGQRRNDVDHKVIMDLYSLSNWHMCPSKSETFYKGAQEAAAMRVPLILNFDYPPFRSIYKDAAIYKQFSSNINITNGLDGSTDTAYNDKKAYMDEIARFINYYNEHTMVLKQYNYQRQEFNLKTIYFKQLSPLLVPVDNYES